MLSNVNSNRPFNGKADCWRISYSREEGSVFMVETWVYEWIKTYKDRPRKLCKLLEPVFEQYVERKANGGLV